MSLLLRRVCTIKYDILKDLMIRYNDPGMNKLLTTKGMALALFLLFVPFGTTVLQAQSAEQTVKHLVEMGFENVGWTEDEQERVYVLQN